MNSKNPNNKNAISYINKLKTLITGLDNERHNINKSMTNLITEKDKAEEDERSNQDIINEHKKLNQLKLKDYRDSLNQLNRGALSLEQQPNEDEDTYLKRIKELVETPYDDESSIIMAKVYNIQKFKDNMKELIRNDVLIDKVLNIIKNQNEDGLFLINEKFNLLKDDFLKTYGFNNESLTAEKVSKILIDFIYLNSLSINTFYLSQQMINNPDVEINFEKMSNLDEMPALEEYGDIETKQLLISNGEKKIYKELEDGDKTLKITNAEHDNSLYLK